MAKSSLHLSRGQLQGAIFFGADALELGRLEPVKLAIQRPPVTAPWYQRSWKHKARCCLQPAKLPKQTRKPRLLGGSRDTSEETETCSICLESLSAEPITALLDGTPPHMVRSCPHYFHSNCAKHLTSSKCPLCRGNYTALSAPIDRTLLHNLSSQDFFSGMLLISGRKRDIFNAERASIPARSLVELLAAVLPIPEVDVRAAVERCVNKQGEVTEAELGRLLRTLGLAGDHRAQRAAEPTIWCSGQG